MYVKLPLFLLSLSFLLFISCNDTSEGVIDPNGEYDYIFTFSESESQKWQADFTDYPVEEEDGFELSHGYATSPEEAAPERPSYKISGRNLSDDLFMYLYRKVDGLEPDTPYEISFAVELASNAPRNSIGIGGSPGAAVYLKAGALSAEPERIQKEVGGRNYWQLKLDKGNQSQAGENMILLGNIGTNLDEFRYTLIERTHQMPFTIRTNQEGEIWIVIGTDSGFEGKTTLYYSGVKLKATKVRQKPN